VVPDGAVPASHCEARRAELGLRDRAKAEGWQENGAPHGS
jgi:hypothetical protein